MVLGEICASGKVKRRMDPPTGPVFGPYSAAVHLNDGASDGQTKPGAVSLGGVERALKMMYSSRSAESNPDF